VATDTASWRLRQIVDTCRDAFIEVDADNRITEWSAQTEVLLGYFRDEMVGHSILEIMAQSTDEVVELGVAVMRSVTADGPPGDASLQPMIVEMELRHKDGSLVLAIGTVFATGAGEAFRIGGFIHRTERQNGQVAEALARDRLHDPLTGLPARTLFTRRLEVAIGSLQRSLGSVAVAVIDLDRFKHVNDSMGHDSGDEVLIALVSRLRVACGSARPLLARLGGDEFLALFESEAQDARHEAELFAKRVLDDLTEPFDIGGTEVFLTVSVGISHTTDPGADARLVLANADAAMHGAKIAGGGDVTVFGEAMRRKVVERMSTEHSLYRALDRRELTLFYQPVVDISRASAVGVEALLRWQHPEQGLVAPDRFIPVAEESGLIIPIGAWVLEEACQQLRSWQGEGSSASVAMMEVNLSARQVDHPDIVPTVESILRSTGLPPGNLTLEITESALMHDAVSALQVLKALKSIGVSLAIDDFGTGYSSLSYLQRFPLDVLKVDKSFVDDLDDGQGAEIVSAVVNLAHALGLRVVAEGVETERQLNALQELGCDFAQGYLFSRPVPASELCERFIVTA
jgi:diguanylate cyclase (GGDEF)-like protein/PAS domain S-box-containing protein